METHPRRLFEKCKTLLNANEKVPRFESNAGVNHLRKFKGVSKQLKAWHGMNYRRSKSFINKKRFLPTSTVGELGRVIVSDLVGE